uniref:Uncharacterized protein n=1 Tax=Arundo donax TaxID=35708 RepID=A0A0A8ZAR2_ARUDO
MIIICLRKQLVPTKLSLCWAKYVFNNEPCPTKITSFHTTRTGGLDCVTEISDVAQCGKKTASTPFPSFNSCP